MHSQVTTDWHTLTLIYICISKISSRKRFCKIQSVSDRITPTVQHLIQRFRTYFLNLMTDIFFNTQNIPPKPFLGHISLSGPTSAPLLVSYVLPSLCFCPLISGLISDVQGVRLSCHPIRHSIFHIKSYQQLCLDFYYSL